MQPLKQLIAAVTSGDRTLFATFLQYRIRVFVPFCSLKWPHHHSVWRDAELPCSIFSLLLLFIREELFLVCFMPTGLCVVVVLTLQFSSFLHTARFFRPNSCMLSFPLSASAFHNSLAKKSLFLTFWYNKLSNSPEPRGGSS